ncbi:MAG: EscU/YscU/HrcU family type III secretion system export apparatus switch protein [Gammaproteobacteria bacterium]|nr:EscU/YscU/HrcU family type III secretion system export apparatus switch protein [Gammaproteobacteria bacterium]MCF6362596.1 EscU/YscU/HrcU family type III secretion system export apparatus switch protein [Gammaproteobacteria bacterium]
MSEKYPPTTAVALHYDGDNAPTVTAKGSGEVAEQIIALAREHGIPLQENATLSELLSRLDLGTEIPPDLYLAVAEVIAFAYLLSGKRPADK